jgi:predicted AAA+ superfamily ATPase
MDAALLARLEALLARIEPLLPPPAVPADWGALAYRWCRRDYLGGARGRLEPVTRIARIEAADLQHIERQKQALLANTAQFVRGLAPASRR